MAAVNVKRDAQGEDQADHFVDEPQVGGSSASRADHCVDHCRFDASFFAFFASFFSFGVFVAAFFCAFFAS
ncbi:hypothetical protein [Caballeronia grimmiae]|uniref:hypothetical protein n=1 Tax=Caballeronia grimmiae TaxID=1071679 RepID=UPI0013638117|nr:hypothetical protein [Caballeronia grimmiae]